MPKTLKTDGNPIIFVGNYGSGKTEVAVNYAAKIKNDFKDLCLVDLDVVNPYFRSREARVSLEKMGIEVLSPSAEQHYAESPIISSRIKSEILNMKQKMILDVGGDDVGARVLASIRDAIEDKNYELYMVLNANRPFTGNVEGCLKILEEVECSSKLKVSGIVSNTHLIDETTFEVIWMGYEMSKKVAQKRGISVHFVTVDVSLRGKIDAEKFDCPILEIDRMMLKPWE